MAVSPADAGDLGFRVGTRPAAPRQARFLGVAEAAKLLRVSESTVRRAIREREIPAFRLRRRYVIPAEAINRLEALALSSGPTDAPETPDSPTQPLDGGPR